MGESTLKEKLEIAKNHLKLWGHSKLFAEANVAEIDLLEKLIKALKYHDPKVNGCFKSSFIRIRRMQKKIADETKHLESVDQQIAKMINNLGNEKLSNLLELRYQQQMPWAEIAKRMFCSESKMFTMHQKALLLVYQRLNPCPTVAESSKQD